MRKMCAGEEKNLQIQEKSINWKNVWKLEEKRVMAGCEVDGEGFLCYDAMIKKGEKSEI